MQSMRLNWAHGEGWTFEKNIAPDAALVIYFGRREALEDGARYCELRERFPPAHIVGCSTGGQINKLDIDDVIVTAVAIKFAAAGVRLAAASITDVGQSRRCGEELGARLCAPGLAGVFVLSDGLTVNGSELVAGLSSALGRHISINGGLAGDGADFRRTLVGADGPPEAGQVAAIGFYGASVQIGHGSAGGWDVFGPRRRITRSIGNILYELDGQPALDLYEKYLGPEEAHGLPGTGLLFPLMVFDPLVPGHDIVRTILAVDRDKRSMTFAGDVPQGWVAQLMRGNLDRLVAGSADAGRQARLEAVEGSSPVALLVSCIGRRLLMGQRVHEEIEAASAELGQEATLLGFYSYGEISPHGSSGFSELHNQTMTVFTVTERAA